ncbi:MAG TPA: AzlC family ABC transporter permease [Roseiflexaceae bacterium]|nr:AzlC family ABC transporter permease [Roseiflexaceae bacterium]
MLEEQSARTALPEQSREEGRTALWAGLKEGFVAILPLWLGSAPFGAVYAVTALAAGLSPGQTLLMSLIVFAGAAQFTAAVLVAAGAAPLAIVLTTLVVNARHLLLAASLAPFVRAERPLIKALLAFQLTDESYALGIQRFLDGRGSTAFQLGANLSLYLCWQLSTIAGMLLGSLIPDPDAYGLGLVFPLTFIALLVPMLREAARARDTVSLAVAALAALLSVGGALLLPGQWYLLIAGLVASGVGAFLMRNRQES